jgi:hypothetical protein
LKNDKLRAPNGQEASSLSSAGKLGGKPPLVSEGTQVLNEVTEMLRYKSFRKIPDGIEKENEIFRNPEGRALIWPDPPQMMIKWPRAVVLLAKPCRVRQGKVYLEAPGV